MNSDNQENNDQSENCPDWANIEILRLRLMEVSLGNIPKSEDWRSNHLVDVQERVFSGVTVANHEDDTERLFDSIARRLDEEGFSPERIAEFFNARIHYPGGPKYCTAEEVLDSLES